MKIGFFVLLVLASFGANANPECSSGYFTRHRTEQTQSLGYVHAGGVGGQWNFYRFEVGRIQRFCLELPYLDVGRRPNFRKYGDLLAFSFVSPSTSGASDIEVAIRYPNGNWYFPPLEGGGPDRMFLMKYKMPGTYIVEVRVNSGTNEYVVTAAENYRCMFKNKLGQYVNSCK